MSQAGLLSTDPRTAPLLWESGCDDLLDSKPVLDALGSVEGVAALARGWQGERAFVVAVAGSRVLMVCVQPPAAMPWRAEIPFGEVAAESPPGRRGPITTMVPT